MYPLKGIKSATNVSLMWFLCILLSLVPTFHDFDLLKVLAENTYQVHKICLSLTPQSEYFEYYAALVCGKNIIQSPTYSLRASGLYHLIVVSGAHLIFLEQIAYKIAPKLRFQKKIVLCLLLFYICLTNWSPPIVRAFIGWNVSIANRTLSLGYKGHHIVLMTGLATLAFSPNWICSLSFQMSWLASLCLTTKLNLVLKNLIIYLALLIPMSHFFIPHPISILVNTIFGTAVGALLFPASLVSYFLPISNFVDQIWYLLFQLLESLSLHFSPLNINKISDLSRLWFVIIGMHLLFVIIDILRNQLWRPFTR